MEIILTVLITLLVCAICYAFIGVVRLERKLNEVDELKMELIDLNVEHKRLVEESHRDLFDRINAVIASTDRRFDKAWDSWKNKGSLTIED